MTNRVVELFYDVRCPYAWYCFEALCRYRTRWNMNLRLRPFYLHDIRERSGNPRGQISPTKAKYLGKDIERMAKHFKVPARLPEASKRKIERLTLNAMHALTVIEETQPGLLEEASRQLWMAYWNRHEDTQELSVIVRALKDAGFSQKRAEEVITQSKSPEVKEKLRATTQAALDYGGFGAPTIVIHKDDDFEMVFGSDRLNVVADILGENFEGPLTQLAKI